MGPTALHPFRRKACRGFFPPKSPTASARFEPAKLGIKGHHATPSPLNVMPLFSPVSNCKMQTWKVQQIPLEGCVLPEKLCLVLEESATAVLAKVCCQKIKHYMWCWFVNFQFNFFLIQKCVLPHWFLCSVVLTHVSGLACYCMYLEGNCIFCLLLNKLWKQVTYVSYFTGLMDGALWLKLLEKHIHHRNERFIKG